MKHAGRILTLMLILLLTVAAVRPCGAIEGVLRIADGQLIDLGQMLAESRSTRYFFVGENHDDSLHHASQLAIIKGLQQSGRTLAIGLEMFATTSQDKLDRWVAGKLSLKEFKKEYARN